MRLVKMIWWWINKEDYHMGDTGNLHLSTRLPRNGCGEEHFAM